MKIDVKHSTPNALKALKDNLSEIMNRIMEPPPRLNLAEWAETNIQLGAFAPEPGPLRYERAMYQREILNTCGDIRHQKVIVMSSAQIGKSTMLLAVIGYHMENDPAPIMYVSSDRSQAESFSTIRLDPCINESPTLRRLLQSKRKRDGGNKKLEKVFPGGFITMVSAKSAHSMRARAIRVLLLDEIDSYESTLGDEGSPIELAIARTSNFSNRKIIMVSTPTVKDFSRIEKEYLASDQRIYEFSCPLCSVYQPFEWGGRESEFGIKWDNDNPSTARYVCKSCKQPIDEIFKHQMLKSGRWTITNSVSKIPGFKVNGLMSPWLSWQSLVSEWLEAQGRPEAIASFVNLRLGESYEDMTNVITVGELASHCHEYDGEVPTGVGILTCGVDVQETWLECAVWGWGKQEEAWLIQSVQFVGDTSQAQVWEDLKIFLKSTFRNKNNAAIPITQTIIDSGFATEIVYRYVKSFREDKINCHPGKGFDGARQIFEWSRYKNAGKPRVGLVGSSQAKGIINARIKNVTAHGSGYIHFRHDTNPEVLEQILSERKITVYSKGNAPKQIWKRIRERNEQLDCVVYAYAALHSLSTNILAEMSKIVEKISGLSGNPGEVKEADKNTTEHPVQKKRTYNIPKRGKGIFSKSWL